ncbi:MAG: DUF4190 domain-containing protein [Acidobacteriota bacterium]
MKRCPQCGQGYSDTDINFCLNDGELLMQYSGEEPQTLFQSDRPGSGEDSPPTLVLPSARVTNQNAWVGASPPAPWQNPTPQSQSPAFGLGGYSVSRDQTLPTIALVLGIFAGLMVCCYGGIWLGVPAAIVGYLGMRNADTDPSRYAGRGLAIGGMVLGIVTFLASMIFLVIGLVAR